MSTAPMRRRTVAATESHQPEAHQTAQVRHRQDVVHEEGQNILLGAERFPAGTQVARVRVTAGMTINVGNFESVRVDVSIEMPCVVDGIEEAYERTTALVADLVGREQERWAPMESGS